MRVVASAAAVVVAAALVVSGAAALGALGPSRPSAPKSGFTIRGHVRGLYPGARRKLQLVVHNRARHAIELRSITTRVRDARPGCSAKYLRVDRFRKRLRLGPRSWRRVSVQVRMLRSAPDACKRATFLLEFRGLAAP
jgi:hypothetical protein